MAQFLPPLRRTAALVGAILAAASLQLTAQGTARAATPAAACIPSGTEAAINAALSGTGATAVLCPGAVFTLGNPVVFTAPNQQLYTQGLPTDSTRAVLRIGGGTLTTAVDGGGQSGVTVQNIQIDGGRPALGRVATGGALMEMGGAGSNQTVQQVYAHDTRSWSTLHLIEGAVTNSVPQCQGAQVLNNQIGPAGTASPDGTWADGISLACGNSLVQGNSVKDATDGGIVVFGAPGSSIRNNTVTAVTQQLLGGINMVDYAPMNGNYTGTTVSGNTINAQSAFIKVGLAMGQQVWNCTTGTNYGASVTGNTLQGAYMGYGYAVNGVSNWTVTGNTDSSTHVGTQTAGGCFGSPRASQTGGFQVETATASTLQSQFSSAVLTNVLSVTGPAPVTPPASVSASPTSVDFGSQNTGTTSAARTVTLSNSGGSAATLSSVTASGDFARSGGSCGSSLAAGASCTVGVVFAPTAAGARSGTLTVAGGSGQSPLTVALSGTGTTPSGNPNLALGAVMTASGSAPGFPPSNANDGNTGSYWESANNALPQWLQADLGSTRALGSITLTLPPSSAWATRAQTLSVQGSTDGSAFSTLVAPASYTFNPATGNSVTIPLPSGTSERDLRLNITANSGWPAGQISEFEIFAGGSSGGNPGGPPAGTDLALGRPASASSSTQGYVPGNTVDGSTSSYWESASNAFPQWLQVDLGASTAVRTAVLDLPPATAWATRTETVQVQGSTDGSTFSTLVGPAGYTFDPASGNTVSITLPAGTSTRYLRLTFSGNTGWPAAQLSELQLFS
ncbi:discoidin domain-containing protein [Streptacidiphilus sp. N1-12]|uniref:Discoidin domain-containing protein n=2 Tax=Streptacidiphilus alkalitolerans TaxID=3342712 RepID=A0ABV6VCC7_9ACTN